MPYFRSGVLGSSIAGGKPKWPFIEQSLSCSPSHCPDVTEVLLKQFVGKDVKQVIHLFFSAFLVKVLTLKVPNKNCSRQHFNFYFYLLKKIRLNGSCESSALQRIHMKYQVLLSLKNNEEIFMNVVCCSCDWRFKG